MPRSLLTQPPVRPRLSGLPPLLGAQTSCGPLPRASPVHPHPSRLPPPRPWGCVAAHCAVCSHAASLARLNSSLVPPSVEIELLVLLSHRASSSAAVTRAAFVATATSTLATVSYAIASLTTVTVVSAAARSRSFAAATSASCRCYTFEATKS
jgi:hypothetical protein